MRQEYSDFLQNDFLIDKYRFFQAPTASYQRTYDFLTRHHDNLKAEFNHIRAVLERDANKIPKIYRDYARYCGTLLQTYYSPDYDDDPVKYAQYTRDLQIVSEDASADVAVSEASSWMTQCCHDVYDVLSTPLHVSKMRDLLGLGNVHRIGLRFSQLTMSSFYTVLQEAIMALLNVSQGPFDLEAMNRRINGPKPIFMALSVGLLVGRLVCNMMLLAKHTWFPNPGEEALDPAQRCYLELSKQYPMLLNDILWGLVNALTNFPAYVGLSIPVMNTLLIVGVVFDFSLLFFRRSMVEQQYHLKRGQYELELKMYQDEPHKEMLSLMIKEQSFERIRLNATFDASLCAAALTVFGCSLTLLSTAPTVLTLGFLMVVVSVALYLSSEKYGQYVEQKERRKESSEAWTAFCHAMLYHTASPLLFMGCLAFSWQLSLLYVCVLYAGQPLASWSWHNLFDQDGDEVSLLKSSRS